MDDLFLVTIIASMAFFLGSLIKGTLGVGLPLVAVPIAALVMSPSDAVALTLAPILVSNIWQLIESGIAYSALQRFWRLIVGLTLGIILGGLLLARIDVSTSTLILGLVLLGFCILQLVPMRFRIQKRDERWLGPAVGFASGLVGGLSGLYGPIMLSYVIALRLEKEAFVGSISLLYLAGVFTLAATLYGNQLLNTYNLLGSLLMLLPMFAGMILGRRLRNKIPQQLFSRLLLAVLALISLSLIWRGWV